MPQARQIESEIQLLVEGNDQRNFFEAFIRHLARQNIQLQNIQLQNFGGVNELRGFLLAFSQMPNFPETVQKIGIVRDAETSATKAFQSVQDSLSNAGLPVPAHPGARTNTSPVVTVLILPGGNRPGMLETLLCESFAATPINDCINDFFQCLEHLPGVSISRQEKARANAYLTTKPEPHVSVGVAAKRGDWDLQHHAFDPIQNFLQILAT